MSALAEASPEAGPAGIDGFLWAGKSYRGLTNKPFLLVSVLWAAKHRTLSKVDAELALYGHDELAPEHGLTSARREANSFFRPKIPLKVSVRGDKVALLDHQWQPRAKKPAKRS